MMESTDQRIQKTAVREIGCEVDYEQNPLIVHENIIRENRDGLKNQLERAHNEYVIDNGDKAETDEGYLRWFDKFPENLLDCHKALRNYPQFQRWF